MTKKLSWIVGITFIFIIFMGTIDPMANRFPVLSSLSSLLTFPSIMLLLIIPFVFFRSKKLERTGKLETKNQLKSIVGYVILAFIMAFLFFVLIFSTV